jgi:hypothetical protein
MMLDGMRIQDHENNVTITIGRLNSLALREGEVVVVRMPRGTPVDKVKRTKKVVQGLFERNRVIIVPDDIIFTKVTEDMLHEDFRKRRGAAEEVGGKWGNDKGPVKAAV